MSTIHALVSQALPVAYSGKRHRTFAHFLRCLVCEGDRRNLLRLVARLQQARNLVHDDA